MNALAEAEEQLRDEIRDIPEPLCNRHLPSDVHEDRFRYGEYVTEGERFFAPNLYATDDPPFVYEITDIRHQGDLFTLVPCYVTSPNDGEYTAPVRDPYWADTISELGGSLEAGELIHLPQNSYKTIDGTTYLTVGSVTVEMDEQDSVESKFGPLDPPNGPVHETLAVLDPAIDALDDDQLRVYVSPNETQGPSMPILGNDQLARPTTSRHNQPDIVTGFETVQRFSKWTFDDSTIRDWVESVFQPGDRILNATAGKTYLTVPQNGEIIRNDLNPDRDADLHVDVGELAAHLEAESFDIIIFDPPWSLYQSNLRYEGHHVTTDSTGASEIDLSDLPFETPSGESKSQLGHARLAKENFNHLLKPGGLFVQLTFHGTAMPARLGYERLERVVFDPIGEGKAVIGSIDQKDSNGGNRRESAIAKDSTSSQQSLGSFG